jgi:starch phosphorylase
MRESMARLTPRFSATRAVREYTEKYYLQAASSYLERAGDKGKRAVNNVRQRRALDQGWAALRFGEAKIETRGEQLVFEVHVHLHDLDPKSVRLDLYADGVGGGDPVRQRMVCVGQSTAAPGCFVFSASVSAARLSTVYTARATSHRDGVAIPLEDARILWQR